MILALGVALAGGVGAGLRWLADVGLRRWRRRGFPWPILLVNVVGCFTLAFLTGSGALISADLQTVVGTGLLGGFTTFSTVSVDAAEMWRQRRYRGAIGNAAGTLLLCIVASVAGLVASFPVA
ncbi:CrcB family protein [Microbacterium sp. G2-8]|uniref:fluoride efflux transporter FluC n=1 Tax=Microbacterium sp. G2-8 TaxID=2842454 RepID=UPI001C8AABCA|nr:CrcB family protein [Microbacterium sp. G2-8]